MDARNLGLRNVEVADTRICAIDGENGKLIYRGYDILDLVSHSTFEETSFLLLFGDLPTQVELSHFTSKLKESRLLNGGIYKSLRNRPKSAASMDVLQSCVSELSNYDNAIHDDSKEINVERSIKLIACIPTIVAPWNRIRRGLEPIDPLHELSHAENFLYMLFGEKPTHEIAKIFDICLILHAEHSFNASTFAAREIASTESSYLCQHKWGHWRAVWISSWRCKHASDENASRNW